LYDLQQPYQGAFLVTTNLIAGNRKINGYYSEHWDGTIPEALVAALKRMIKMNVY